MLAVGGVAHGVEMKRCQADWGWLRHRRCNHPYLLMIGIKHKIVGMMLVGWNGRQCSHPPSIPTKPTLRGVSHGVRCEDEAALSSLGVAAPQVMKSPIAADKHGVPFSDICVV